MRTRFLQRPNRSEGPCGKACRIEGAEEPQGPSGLLPPQACNTGPLGDPGTRALKKACARFTAVGMTTTRERIVCDPEIRPLVQAVALDHPRQNGDSDDDPVDGEGCETALSHPIHEPGHDSPGHKERDHKADDQHDPLMRIDRHATESGFTGMST